MALKKTLTVKDQFGDEHVVNNAYIQVYEVAGNKHGVIAQYFIKKPDKVNVMERRQVGFVPSMDDGAGNFIKQVYDYLKTLPDFKDAEDC